MNLVHPFERPGQELGLGGAICSRDSERLHSVARRAYHSLMHPSRDHHLPPDPDAYRHAPHPKGRIIVIAPTRAACETIELALGLHLDTLLEREHGAEIRELAASGQGLRHRGGHRAPARRSRSGPSPRRSCGSRSRSAW